MPKKLVILLITLCTVLVGLTLTFEVTLATDAPAGADPGMIPYKNTKTPTPKPTKQPKPTRTPDYTSTPAPTSPPSVKGTAGFVPTPIQGPPPDFGGAGSENSVLVDPLVGKLFIASGFPGLSQGSDTEGVYTYAKNRNQGPTLMAYWYLEVKQGGYYDVYAYVPVNPSATHSAEYHVFQNNQLSAPIVVDQLANAGRWANLGSYYFVEGTLGDQYVVLSNQTKEADSASVVLCSTVYLAFRP